MLILQIQSYQKQNPNQTSTLTVDQGTIAIGRDITNDWSLSDPDRVLSKRHCLIECRDGKYFVTDTSTNGVFVNTSTNAVGRDNSVTINAGDVIRMGDYEISVGIENIQPSSVKPDLQPPDVTPEQIVQTPPPPPPVDMIPENSDWKAMLEPTSVQIPSQSNVETNHAVDMPDIAQAHYDAPSSGMSIPDDWGMPEQPVSETPVMPTPPPIDSYTPPSAVVPPPEEKAQTLPQANQIPGAGAPHIQEPSAPSTAETPVSSVLSEPVMQTQAPVQQPVTPMHPPSTPATSATSGQGDDLVKAFLSGAGIDPNLSLQVGAEAMMKEMGSLFRQVTMGVMGVLAARGDIKGEFRLSQTMIRPTENNPLKFSLNIDEAMIALINKKGAGYMAADAAFEEAFDDLKAHQVAVLSGMQEALKGLLKKFDPQLIEQDEANSGGMKKILGASKSKHWDKFVSMYKTVQRDTEDDFQNSFGREFAKAYEQQIQNQKTNKS